MRGPPGSQVRASSGSPPPLPSRAPARGRGPRGRPRLRHAPSSWSRRPTWTSCTSARPTTCTSRSAQAALAAGKHVICEKPIALDGAGAQALERRRRRAAAIASVPFVYRYYPTVREARERVRTGVSGPIRLLHGSYLQDWLLRPEDDNWRVDAALGGASRAFADIGSHWCDLAEFVSGHRITKVSARAADRAARAPRERGARRLRRRRRPRRAEGRRHRGRGADPVRDRPGRARHRGHQPDLGRPQEPPAARARRRRGGARVQPGGAGVAVGRPPRGGDAAQARPRAPDRGRRPLRPPAARPPAGLRRLLRRVRRRDLRRGRSGRGRPRACRPSPTACAPPASPTPCSPRRARTRWVDLTASVPA